MACYITEDSCNLLLGMLQASAPGRPSSQPEHHSSRDAWTRSVKAPEMLRHIRPTERLLCTYPPQGAAPGPASSKFHGMQGLASLVKQAEASLAARAVKASRRQTKPCTSAQCVEGIRVQGAPEKRRQSCTQARGLFFAALAGVLAWLGHILLWCRCSFSCWWECLLACLTHSRSFTSNRLLAGQALLQCLTKLRKRPRFTSCCSCRVARQFAVGCPWRC